MANNYTEFSFMLDNVSDEELSWLTHFERRFYDLYEDDFFGPAYYERSGDGLWFNSDAGEGDIDFTAYLIHRFLHHFKRPDIVSFTWAATCSKPRVGEFGGGGVIISAKEVNFWDAWSWVEKTKEAMAK